MTLKYLIDFCLKVHTNWRNSSIEWCSFCLENPDKIGPSMEESLKHRLQTAGVTKPGTKRRRRDNEGKLILTPETSPSHTNNSSTDVTDGRGGLYGEIQEFVDDLDDINIDDLVRHVPDLIIPSLMGEMETGDSPSPDAQTFERCLSPSPTSVSARARLSTERRYREEFDVECNYTAVDLPAESPPILLDYDNIPAELLQRNSSPPGAARGGSQVQSLTERFRRRERGGSQVSDNSLESDSKVVSSTSLISRLNKINKTSSREGSSSTDSAYKSDEIFDDEENEAKVSELTKRFGGARKACLDKIKTKISKPDQDRSLVEAKGTRGDCFPAMVFMLTPLAVLIFAGWKQFLEKILYFVTEILFQLFSTFCGVSTPESLISYPSKSAPARHSNIKYVPLPEGRDKLSVVPSQHP